MGDNSIVFLYGKIYFLWKYNIEMAKIKVIKIENEELQVNS
jgi:hypothetical protein